MANIVGGQLGLLILVCMLALGLEALTTSLAWLFEWIRIAGALYLIWLGYNLLRSDGTFGAENNTSKMSTKALFWQGFMVAISNPKVLLFFGAFLPQFIDPTGNAALQTMGLGLIFMLIATIIDGGYAFAAGGAGSLLTKKRVRTAEVSAGSLMIGGGLWLALNRN